MFRWGVEEPITKPENFAKDLSLPNDAILFFTNPVRDEVCRLLLRDREILPSIKPYVGVYEGYEIALLYPCFGAPATIMAIEIAYVAGIKRLFMLGEAGAIHDSLVIGDFFIPIWGYREEGTSFHYIPYGDKIEYETELSKKFSGFLTEKGVKHFIGGVWTTDALFRETLDKIRYFSGLGVKCVDMESTAVLAYSLYRGLDTVIFLTISDELYHGRWRTGWNTNALVKREVESLHLTLEYITGIKVGDN